MEYTFFISFALFIAVISLSYGIFQQRKIEMITEVLNSVVDDVEEHHSIIKKSKKQ